MSEAIIAKKAEQVAIVAEKMKAAASIVVVDLQLTKIQFFVVIFVNQALNLKLSKTQS